MHIERWSQQQPCSVMLSNLFDIRCYSAFMTNKAASKVKRRRTTSVPVTTMEDIPVLSDSERADLITSLREAEARVKAGKATDYDPKAFKKRLIDIYRGGKR